MFSWYKPPKQQHVKADYYSSSSKLQCLLWFLSHDNAHKVSNLSFIRAGASGDDKKREVFLQTSSGSHSRLVIKGSVHKFILKSSRASLPISPPIPHPLFCFPFGRPVVVVNFFLPPCI